MTEKSSEILTCHAVPMSVGERVKALRKTRGWTQEQLAQATGVSRSAVAQWETGRAGFGAKARLIAHVLDVPMCALQAGLSSDLPLLFNDPNQVSNEEFALLRRFRELGIDDQACLIQIATKLASVVRKPATYAVVCEATRSPELP